MRRRSFCELLASAAVFGPLSAQAQQQVRRVGALYLIGPDDATSEARHGAFVQALEQLGWVDGENVRIEVRWAGGNADKLGKYSAELASLAPDAILVSGGAVEEALRASRTVPMVFVVTPDPVGSGYVDSLSRPGGNITGFMQFEYTLCGKWLELLKQVAPETRRVAILRDPTVAAGIGQFAVIQSAAPSVGVEVSPISLRDTSEIERRVATFARSPNSGLILTAGALGAFNRNLIIALAAKHKLPSVYPTRLFAADGGLISYGADFLEQYRGAAGYIDRILKGEKPADMPVQAPTKYELLINLKTANALGLAVPPFLLARADEVIE